MTIYSQYFKAATTSKENPDGFQPRQWQNNLGTNANVGDQLIRIPTGEGKTLGVLSTWLYHAIEKNDPAWPRRLVWCLPMRTLVDQTYNEANKILANLDLQKSVNVHRLMGGVDENRWYQAPDQPAILIGTQDMLLSRALNRGYAMGRAAWPRAFGLLHSDCLWVMDEVQLMGVGLATSAQIQSFWDDSEQNRKTGGRPRATWWMSATLQSDWLRTPETNDMVDVLSKNIVQVPEESRTGSQWDAVKPIHRIELKSKPENSCELVLEKHQQQLAHEKFGRQTLVVVNTVKLARELFQGLQKLLKGDENQIETRLIHSRFRPAEREDWIEQFLSRDTLTPSTNRILVATQVVEAGVDISATCLVTELAPWPSLVQRFGRAARYGGSAEIVILDQNHTDAKKSLPYQIEELDAARNAIEKIDDASIDSLEKFESQLSESGLKELYPYKPLHVILADEFEELFDTSPDLSGADVDVSRFIREGEDRDVKVFWRAWEDKRPESTIRPQRRELCSVSITDARKWLNKDHVKKRVWSWDYLDGIWRRADPSQLKPGQTMLVHPDVGGYDQSLGFTGATPKKKDKAVPVVAEDLDLTDGSSDDYSESSDSLSYTDVWKTIATHCKEAADLATQLSKNVGLQSELIKIVRLTLQLHDWGKAHPTFASGTYRVTPERNDLAKAPAHAWQRQPLYDTPSHGHRRGFRHELASCLATLELLRSTAPDHPAILGRYEPLIQACGMAPDRPKELLPSSQISNSLQSLSETEFNLLLYLIASHHGKVRTSIQASPTDQEFPYENDTFVGDGMPVRGVRDGDVLPTVELPGDDGEDKLPAIQISLAPAAMGLSAKYGASWSERVQTLIATYGTFTLGLLEAIVRAADCQASDDKHPPGSNPDPKLAGIKFDVPQETSESNSENVTPTMENEIHSIQSDTASEVSNV